MKSEQNWSPWHEYSRKKDWALKGSCSAEICLGVSLPLQNRAVFFVSANQGNHSLQDVVGQILKASARS